MRNRSFFYPNPHRTEGMDVGGGKIGKTLWKIKSGDQRSSLPRFHQESLHIYFSGSLSVTLTPTRRQENSPPSCFVAVNLNILKLSLRIDTGTELRGLLSVKKCQSSWKFLYYFYARKSECVRICILIEGDSSDALLQVHTYIHS